MKKEDDQLNAFIANKQSGNRIIALLPVNCLSGSSAQNNHSPSQHLTKVDIYTARLKLAYNIPAFSYIAQQRQPLHHFYSEEPCLLPIRTRAKTLGPRSKRTDCLPTPVSTQGKWFQGITDSKVTIAPCRQRSQHEQGRRGGRRGAAQAPRQPGPGFPTWVSDIP